MGNREYAFLLQKAADVRALMEFVDAHNEACEKGVDTGSEDLMYGPLVKFEGELFACVHAMGGQLHEWWKDNMKEPLIVLWPFNKPRGWHEAPVVKKDEELPHQPEDFYEALKDWPGPDLDD